MGKIRVDAKFYGGPHDGRLASLTYIPDVIWFHDGSMLTIHAYVKVEELTYVHSDLSTMTFSRDEEGRSNFLDRCLVIPDYGTEWKNSDEVT